MSANGSAMLFSPEGAPLRDPAEIERALNEMWQTSAMAATAQSDVQATRASVANLIVVAPALEEDIIQDTLAELARDYPSRTILLLISDSPSTGDITASISAICRVPQDGETEVCCEQIIVRSNPQHVEELDQTLLPMLESDVPVMCWWRFDARAWPTLFTAILPLARRIILDEGGIQRHAESSPDCALRDIGWYRTAGLRELVAQLFDGCGPRMLQAVESVEIDTGGMIGGEIDGFWLTAFLAGQLGWKPIDLESLDDLSAGTSGGIFRFQSGERTVKVRITTHAGGGGRLRQMSIVSGESSFKLEYHAAGENEYRVIVCTCDVCQAPRSVQVRCLRANEALAAALVGRPVDAAYERAHPIAVWMFHNARQE